MFDQQQTSVFLIPHRWRVLSRLLLLLLLLGPARSSPRKIQPHFFSAVLSSFSSFIFSTCVFSSGYTTHWIFSSFLPLLDTVCTLIFILGWAAQLEAQLLLFACSLNCVHIQSHRWSVNFMSDEIGEGLVHQTVLQIFIRNPRHSSFLSSCRFSSAPVSSWKLLHSYFAFCMKSAACWKSNSNCFIWGCT